MSINYEEIAKTVFNKEEIKDQLTEIERLLSMLKVADDLKIELDIISKINKIRDHFLTLYWISYIGYLLNINDKKYVDSEKIMAELEPIMDSLKLKYYKILIHSSHREELETILGSRLFEIANNESVLASNNIQAFNKEEKELYKQYMSLIINTKFLFNGEELNLSKLIKYQRSDDREIRKKAYDKRFEILTSLEEEIDNIFQKLIKVRTKIAQELGFSSYSQVGDIKMNRIGYGEADIQIFRNQVKEYIVPLMNKLSEMQCHRLELDRLRYYDSGYLFADGNAKISKDLEGVINTMSTILKKVSETSGKLFDEMIKSGLIDLSDKEGKSNGGITTFLPDYQMPLFIKKYMGIDDNITTIHHEFGHAQQLYYSRNLTYHENRWPTFDICEIHSTAMEFLMYPYLEEYFGEDTKKYKIKHLTGILSTLITMCAMDEFQHFLYDNPTISMEERKYKWLNICEEYFPLRDKNHDYFIRGIEWQIDSNRVENPFYGIDYAIAAICALSFYEKMKTNEKNAWNDYIVLCKIGGSKSLKSLIEIAGLNNPFVEESLKSIAQTLEEDIKVLSKSFNK